MSASYDPSPEEIAAACLEIQAGWSPAEKLRRMRSDMRPHVSGADGRQHDVSAESYFQPIATNEQARRICDAMHKAGDL